MSDSDHETQVAQIEREYRQALAELLALTRPQIPYQSL